MKEKKAKITPTSIYFLGSPDKLHLLSSMISDKDQFVMVENADEAELHLVEEKMASLAKKILPECSTQIVSLDVLEQDSQKQVRTLLQRWEARKNQVPSIEKE